MPKKKQKIKNLSEEEKARVAGRGLGSGYAQKAASAVMKRNETMKHILYEIDGDESKKRKY